MNQALDTIIERFLEPLNEETRTLLAPIRVINDYVELSCDDTGKNFIAKFYAKLGDRMAYPSYSTTKLLQRIPQRKPLANDYNDGSSLWRLAGTDFTALVLHAVWPSDHIIFDEEARMLFTFLLTRFLRQTQSAQQYAEYKIHGIVPQKLDKFIDHPDYPLMSFQQVAVFAQSHMEGSNLWMEQGTGKTPIVISRINYEAHQTFIKEKRMYRALIVVPKNVRTGWQKKIMQFAIRPGKVTILSGGQLNRIKLLVDAFKPDEKSEYTIVICSYETVLRSWNAMRLVEWDLCTLDEAHMIKSSSTKRWKQMKELRERCVARCGLTGTPFANTLFDVFTQLEWLGEGLSGFTNYKAFKSYYGKFLPKDAERKFDVLTGYQNLPILQERIARLCFQVTRKEALPELPDKTYDVIDVIMTDRQRDFYMKLRDQLMIEIEADLQRGSDTPKQLTANHILTKLLRLSQITAGYLKWDAQMNDDGDILNEDSMFEEITPNPKIEALIEFIQSTGPKDKVIVWCNWVPALKAISRRMTEVGIKNVLYYGGTSDKDRNEAERAYNEDPDMKCFNGNPAAGGTGLDLWGHIPTWVGTDKDHGCDTRYVCYLSQNWSMIHRSQSEDRAMRRGTRKSVQVLDFICPGTIDEEIAKRVLKKQMNALELQDVRDVMHRILAAIPMSNEQ